MANLSEPCQPDCSVYFAGSLVSNGKYLRKPGGYIMRWMQLVRRIVQGPCLKFLLKDYRKPWVHARTAPLFIVGLPPFLNSRLGFA